MLYKWMRKEVSPSWVMIIEALEKVSELRLAHQLREKYCTQQYTEENLPTSTSEDHADLQTIERVLKVDRKDRIAREIEGFEDRYLNIVNKTEIALESTNPSPRKIKRFCNYYMSKKVTNVEELFDQLQPLDYLNYTMLEKIINFLLNEDQRVVSDLNNYIQDLEKFKLSTSVQEFMESIEAAQRPLSAAETSGTITVTLRLVGGWLTKTMDDLDKLLKVLFEDKSSVLSHVKIVRGSVIITYLAPQAEVDSLVTISTGKVSFMVQVGVIELQVGDTVVTSTQSRTLDFSFESSLIKSVKNNDVNVLNFLLNINTSPDAADDNKQTALAWGSHLGNSKAVSVLLKANANPNISRIDGATPLHLATYRGDSHIVGVLLDANANPSPQTVDGNTPLYIASQKSYSHIFGLLLEANANPNLQIVSGTTPLLASSYSGHADIVQLLLNVNADSNLESDYGMTSLYAASQEGHIDVISLLLKANACLNHLNGGAGTSLFKASECGHTDIVRLLLKANANPNLQADNGRSPLLAASMNGHCDVVSLLLQAGADANLYTKDIVTPLMSACFNRYPQVVRLLLTRGADLNLQTVDDGFTALMCACRVGCFESAELLLIYGADYSLQSHDGLTALDMAACKGHDDIADLIQTIELSLSPFNSPVLTPTEITINVDNKARASSYRAMERILVDETESFVSAKYQKLEKILSPKHEQQIFF